MEILALAVLTPLDALLHFQDSWVIIDTFPKEALFFPSYNTK